MGINLINFSGPPSSGKTSVILKVSEHLKKRRLKVGVVKFDCLSTDDDKIYEKNGIIGRKGLAGGLCPDHYFVSNIEEVVAFGVKKKLDVLITESAGLCNRCSPYIKGVLGVCVIDNLSGVNTPKKIGPMLKTADIIVITKGDIVSQGEREVFSYKVTEENQRAIVVNINGLNGEGSYELSSIIYDEFDNINEVKDMTLRFSMPSSICSYCLGEKKIGSKNQMGNVKKIVLED